MTLTCSLMIAVSLLLSIPGARVAAPRVWSITILGPAGDPRLAAVAEAIDYWNEQLEIAHANARLGSYTRADLTVPDDVLRSMSDGVLGSGPSSSRTSSDTSSGSRTTAIRRS
jgi:hypothetical protein